jgi:hypothetical protein
MAKKRNSTRERRVSQFLKSGLLLWGPTPLAGHAGNSTPKWHLRGSSWARPLFSHHTARVTEKQDLRKYLEPVICRLQQQSSNVKFFLIKLKPRVWARRVAQVVEQLPSKYETLSSDLLPQKSPKIWRNKL